MVSRAYVGFVSLEFPDWRFRVVFQEEIHPLPKSQILPLSDNFQEVSVSGLKPFPQFLLGFVPVFRKGRLFSEAAIPFPVPHPPEIRPLSPIYNTIVLNGSCHSPSPF